MLHSFQATNTTRTIEEETVMETYTHEEARRVMEELLATIKARKNEADVPYHFIDRHPWTLKYLSHFAEANELFALCRKGGVEIVEAPWNTAIQKIRTERGARHQLRFRITDPGLFGAYSRWLFVFEEQENGKFVPLNR